MPSDHGSTLWHRAKPVSRRLRGQQCGIALGGVGTGGFELWDDGRFRIWQIFNNGTFVRGRFRTPLTSPMPPGGLFFAVRTVSEGRCGLWKLHMPCFTEGQWIEEPYHLPDLQFPEEIAFYGRQPFARLEYQLARCPVQVSLQASTPFVVHDLDASAWPVAMFKINFRNNSSSPVSVAQIASLANCIGGYQCEDSRPHEIINDEGLLTVFYPAGSAAPAADVGSMALSVLGPPEQLSHCRKWSAVDINPALFWAQMEAENRLQGDQAKVVKRMLLAEAAKRIGWQGPDGLVADLAEEDRESLARQVRQFHEGPLIEDHLGRYKITSDGGPHFARDLMLEQILRRLYAVPPFFGSVARTVTMAPGANASTSFLLSWHFPHHITAPLPRGSSNTAVEDARPETSVKLCECDNEGEQVRGPNHVGHRYGLFGADALSIAHRFSEQAESLEQRSAAFTAALYDSTLPEWLADAINAQITSIVTNSWYTEDGRFVMWPGSGCCGFAEIGTGFFGTIPLILFFPQAAQRQLEMILERQADDGRVPHSFAGDFEQLTVYYDDDYLKVPLQVYRDWVWTGDDGYLKRIWPRLLKLLEASRRLDIDGDGIPDMRGQNQDYDQWLMFGLGIYSGSHWPIVLRTMARMGRFLGHAERLCDQWEAEAEEAAQRIDAALWRGDWYGLYLDRDKQVSSDALLVNNLCGEWYARLTGLSPSLPRPNIRRNLQSVFQNNRQPGVGLRCGWFPQGQKRQIGTRDWHWDVCWLGAEYAVASHMIYEGLVDQGLTVCREAHERHHRQSLRYNHFECGEHYTRALDVWSVLLALQGFQWDAIGKRLTFSPAITPENHRSVLVLPSGWGRVRQTLRQGACQWKLQIGEGQLELRSLELCRESCSALLNGHQMEYTCTGTVTRFNQEVRIQSGQTLEITLQEELPTR